jgi:putative methanogenesis marker protein 17
MENLFIECEDESAVEAYRQIVKYMLLDMNIKSLESVRIYADPTGPFFSCRVDFKKVGSPLTIGDLSTMRPVGEDIDLVIGDERYLPDMLRKLWDVYGRDNVEQPERFHIIVKGKGVNVEELLNIVIVDPLEKFYEQLVTFAIEIIPTGFRVRHVEYASNSVMVVASESVIEREWIERSKEKLQWSS